MRRNALITGLKKAMMELFCHINSGQMQKKIWREFGRMICAEIAKNELLDRSTKMSIYISVILV